MKRCPLGRGFGNVCLVNRGECEDCRLFEKCCVQATLVRKLVGVLPYPRNVKERPAVFDASPSVTAFDLRVYDKVHALLSEIPNLVSYGTNKEKWKVVTDEASRGIPVLTVIRCNKAGITAKTVQLIPKVLKNLFSKDVTGVSSIGKGTGCRFSVKRPENLVEPVRLLAERLS